MFVLYGLSPLSLTPYLQDYACGGVRFWSLHVTFGDLSEAEEEAKRAVELEGKAESFEQWAYGHCQEETRGFLRSVEDLAHKQRPLAPHLFCPFQLPFRYDSRYSSWFRP